MIQAAQRCLHRLVRRCGYELTPAAQPDFDASARDLIRRVQPYTMTSPERLFALHESVKYIVKHGVPGDIVECGVWKGGSMLTVALTLRQLGVADRMLHLFDTYEGLPAPSAADRNLFGEAAAELMGAESKDASWNWAYAPLEAVQATMRDSGYDESCIRYVKGKVEDTLPAAAPETIALLRLDTDWYESTRHELTHLFPRLAVGGVLIIDDYGHWAGVRRAVDEYFEEHRVPALLNRIDYTARVCVKLAPHRADG